MPRLSQITRLPMPVRQNAAVTAELFPIPRFPPARPAPQRLLSVGIARAADDYGARLVDACAEVRGRRPSPIDVLLNRGHEQASKLEHIEFIVGWFDGLSQGTGIPLKKIWGHVSSMKYTAAAIARVAELPKRKRKGKR